MKPFWRLWKKSHCTWRSRERRSFLLFLAPSFLGVLIFVIFPFMDVVKRSFTTAVTSEFVGAANYRTVFANEAFRLAVKNTAVFTIVCIPLLVVSGFIAAVLLSHISGSGAVKSFSLLPMAMPTAAVAIVWEMIFYKPSFSVLVISYIWKNIGYTIVLWFAGILAVSKETIEAAQVDGAGGIRIFRYIILPDLKGSLFTIVILSILNSFKIYREAYLVAGSYPPKDMYLLQHLFNNWFVNLELDKMAAATVCTGVVLFVMIFILQKLWDNEM